MKDVDGLHPLNAGELYLGRPTLVGGDAAGVMELLAEHEVELDGARAVVVGRSDDRRQADGAAARCRRTRPSRSATRTRATCARHTLDADVLVAAVGVPALVTPDMVKAGASSSTSAINRTEAGLVGDVDPGADGGRRADHAGAGRRRADDDRLPAAERRSLRAASPR